MHRDQLRRGRRRDRLDALQDDAVAILQHELARQLRRCSRSGPACRSRRRKSSSSVTSTGAVAFRIDERDAVLEVAAIDALLPRCRRRRRHGLAELGIVFVEPGDAAVALGLRR